MLPLKTRLTIKPWVQDTTLPETKRFLHDNDLRLLYYRQACAAIFPKLDGYCLIHFKETSALSQGFIPAKTECSICNKAMSIDDLCPHLAALMSQTLLTRDDDDPLLAFPAPLAYKHSGCKHIATFCNNHKTRTKISLTKDDDDHLLLQTDNFTAQIYLEEKYRPLLQAIFPNYQFPPSKSSDEICTDTVTTAWEKLFNICRSTTEEALNLARTTSKGQTDDKSLWSLLCQFLFAAQPHIDWQLQREADNLFTLCAGPLDSAALRITPAREKLIPLLKQTDNLQLIRIEEAARAYAKIYFQDNDNLIIEPWLELANGEKHQRGTVEEYIFGTYFSRTDNIFAPIEEHGDDFSPPSASGNMPLLQLTLKPGPADSTTIPAPDVPAFLDRHLQDIISGPHDHDPALEDFIITDLPDGIDILDYKEDNDWCYLSARYTCGNRQLDLRDILALRDQGKEHATSKGKWLQVNNTPLDWLYDLEADRVQENENGTTLRLTRLEMTALTALVPKLNLPSKKERRQDIGKLLKNLKGRELAKADIPAHLRTYQQTGLAWLNNLCANGIGGILADDMGLGKTHQALALMQIVLRRRGGPALVVCPASVLPHWQEKIDEFYPDLNYTLHYGQKRQFTPPTDTDIILTTYVIMRQDIDLLTNCPFGLVIFDEIQYLKNRTTSTNKAAAALNGLVCFGLSGTPIENSLTDLKAIYDICLPGLLGGHSEFKKTYVVPIEENKDQNRLATLQRLTSPFMLRRNKSAVLQELPEVIEDIRHCYLSADQQSLYQQAIDQQDQALLAATDDTSKAFPHMSFLALVQRLKQICNHPSQLGKNTDYNKYKSGKWELFKEILSECLAADLKVVVFSQYTGMLDLISRYLTDMDIPQAGLRGSTSMDKRRKQVQQFNNDPAIKVFCASLLAGGTGIDLTGAQAVIHYDRWWNSAKEEQATARVHRFGQRQAVQVFKFITTGTMEEKIHQLIDKKQNLAADAIISDDSSVLKKLSREEIAAILKWAPSAYVRG